MNTLAHPKTESGAIPRALAVAASDSSGAAGLQADLKTFEARGVYGLSAVTALTAQDSTAIHALRLMEPGFVADQIRAVLADIGADAIKTGLLLRAPIIEAVAGALTGTSAPLIVDPVLVSGDGRRLVDDATIAAYTARLFSRALLITPNLDEASILTGAPVADPAAMREAARMLYALGPRYVLVKGGHLPGTLESAGMLDILYDGEQFHEYRSARLPVANARGTGCTFAACITAEVAKGRAIPVAVDVARRYVAAALAAAADWHLGHGRGTVFHAVRRPPLFED
jgi:hydroxymethylpyrimidine/phosphomethylpyrimidine kinase